jgi:hypothetical protein
LVDITMCRIYGLVARTSRGGYVVLSTLKMGFTGVRVNIAHKHKEKKLYL